MVPMVQVRPRDAAGARAPASETASQLVSNRLMVSAAAAASAASSNTMFMSALSGTRTWARAQLSTLSSARRGCSTLATDTIYKPKPLLILGASWSHPRQDEALPNHRVGREPHAVRLPWSRLPQCRHVERWVEPAAAAAAAAAPPPRHALPGELLLAGVLPIDQMRDHVGAMALLSRRIPRR